MDFLAAHETSSLVDAFILEAIELATGHHLARGHLPEIIAGCNGTAGDIPVGNHANESVVFTNRHASYAVIPHDAGHLRNRNLRCDPLHIATPHFFHQHGLLPT